MRLCPIIHYSSQKIPGEASITGITQGNLGLTLPPISLDLHQTQKTEMKSWTDPASSFHFPETVQVFSNATPITQNSINPQQNKNQSPLAKPSAITRHLARGRPEGKLSNP